MNLNLLVPATTNSEIITIQNHQLQLVSLPAEDWGATPYACISFAWGKAKTVNPLDASTLISARALSVLDTAIRTVNHIAENGTAPAIWMDTFCIPNDTDIREVYLRSMGEIYAHAAQVIVVLSSDMAPLLQSIRKSGRITEEELLLLETDEWVTRAWTYQEIVNSSELFYMAEGETDAPVGGYDFFVAIAYAIQAFGQAKQYGEFVMQTLYPRMSALEAVMVDWKLAPYQERSAYQVMTNMCYRVSDLPNGLIYAMIGCILNTQPQLDMAALPPSELFMQVCETKGDFSFIYSTAARGAQANKSWRPGDGTLRPVLPWLFCYGQGQAGVLHSDYLELKDVGILKKGVIADSSTVSIMQTMTNHAETPPTDSIAYILQYLREIGFTGCGQHIELEKRIFFPQSLIDNHTDIQIITATEINWTFGAPGLLVKPIDADQYSYVDVGVFVGLPIKSQLTIQLV